ncbi:MAG: histidine kinase [Ginsengibacter sp.]
MNSAQSKYLSLLLAVLLQYGIVFSQSEGAIKLPVFRQVSYPFLPTISSNYFFFSQDGLMWFSTAQGLTSFDGSGVVFHSNVTETNDYGLSRIYKMAEDKNHNFYIGSAQGFIYFNRKAKQFSSLKYGYNNSRVTHAANAISFYIDKDETVYAGTANQGLYIYHPAGKHMEHFNLDLSQPDNWNDRIGNTITSFSEGQGNTSQLWVGSFNGIYSFDKISKKFKKNFTVINPQFNLLGQARTYYDVEDMHMRSDSLIWFNIWSGGFAEYNTHTGKCFIYTQAKHPVSGKNIPGYIIPTFAEISDGLYLLGISNRKPAIFSIKDKTLHFFNVTADTAINDAIRCVEKDPKGNIWLIRNGMLYVNMPDYSRLQSKKLIQEYSDNYNDELRGIYFDTTAKKYYCTVRMSTGVHVLDSNFNFVRIIPTPLFTNFYTYRQTCTDRITRDGSGRFWTTGRETYVMLPGQNKFDRVGKVLPSLSWIEKKEQFTDIVSTAEGNILLQEAGTGTIYLVDHKTLHTDTIKVPQFNSRNNNKISESTLCYDALRNVIYLANNGGIAQYNFHKKTLQKISYKEMFGTEEPDQVIMKYSVDDKGRLWLLKDKYGIRIIDPETLLCADSIPFGSRGLMQAYFTNISFGGNNRMFLRSLNGVVVYDYKMAQSFLFDNSNGLSFPDVISMLYCNSHLLIGMRNTIEYYDLRQLTKNNFHPTPQLNIVMADTAVVFTREAAEEKVITLKHDQNTLTFSFSAPEFVFPERIEYAYLLEGVNNQWQYASYFNRKITYNNLSPGKYIFRLKAQMQEGNWIEPSVNYIVMILPAWWQTSLFKILVVFGAIILAWLLIQWRINTVRKQEQVRNHHEKELLLLEARALRTQMNPHFIFNCLNSIKSLIQENKNEKSVTYLTTFSKLIRTLFHNADKKEITLYDEIETCKLYLQLEAMRFDSRFSFSVNVENNFDLKSTVIPALIIQPFIENAIWHGIVPRGMDGNVWLTVTANKGQVNITVEDDGIGREISQLNKSGSSITHHSKGVNLTQSRLELDNLLRQRRAKIDIIDKKDEAGNPQGTKVIITINEEI